MIFDPKWLNKDIVKGVKGMNLDSYLLALAGWQRGLQLCWHLFSDDFTLGETTYTSGNCFSLASNNEVHYFLKANGDKNSIQANQFVSNNERVTRHLELKQLLTIKDKSFSSSKVGEKLLPYAEKTTYHFYVIENNVVAAVECIPAYVVGDGQSTIKQLIDTKNVIRRENAYWRKKSIKINSKTNKVLDKAGYSLDAIPEENTIVCLREDSNILHGGETINVLEDIPFEVKQTVINAVQSIEGINHTGIELVYDNNQYIIKEINPNVSIAMFMFPTMGNGVDLAKLLIDYYFKDYPVINGNERLYFPYPPIQKMLINGVVEKCIIPKCVTFSFIAKKYVVKGKVQKVSYRKWIQKQARLQGLIGYTRNLKNGDVEVIVAGEQKTVESFKKVCEQGSPRANVTNVIESDWRGPINIGFTIKKTK